jgi:hypothetical protein
LMFIIFLAELFAHFSRTCVPIIVEVQVVVHLPEVTAARFSCVCRSWIKWQIKTRSVFVQIHRARVVIGE